MKITKHDTHARISKMRELLAELQIAGHDALRGAGKDTLPEVVSHLRFAVQTLDAAFSCISEAGRLTYLDGGHGWKAEIASNDNDLWKAYLK